MNVQAAFHVTSVTEFLSAPPGEMTSLVESCLFNFRLVDTGSSLSPPGNTDAFSRRTYLYRDTGPSIRITTVYIASDCVLFAFPDGVALGGQARKCGSSQVDRRHAQSRPQHPYGEYLSWNFLNNSITVIKFLTPNHQTVVKFRKGTTLNL